MRSLSAVKLHEGTEVFVMVDYVREMTSKKSCIYIANMDRFSICCLLVCLFLVLFCFILFCFVLLCGCHFNYSLTIHATPTVVV